MAWQWNIKVHREDDSPPAPTILNIGQFMTDEETAGGMGEPHWFMAYSCTLQLVGEVAHGRKWEWPRREALEVKPSLLVHAFWCETGADLTMASIKLCWEPHHPCNHFPGQVGCLHPQPGCMGPDGVANLSSYTHALTEAELYGYCQGQAVDLSPVMPVAQFQVMEEVGAYLCTARALVFEGSILAYNSAMNEAEWVPVCSLANDLSWAKERSAVALANYVPCVPAEAAWIARLRASRIVSCPSKDSSTSVEEEKAWHSDTQSTNPPMDMDPKPGDESEDGVGGQTDPEDAAEGNRWQHTLELGSNHGRG